MNIDATYIAKLRTERAWSQEDLARAAGLNLRTIQRIERNGTASLQSTRALATALEIDIQDLDNTTPTMAPCPECRSAEVYKFRRAVDSSTMGDELLPKLSTSRFSAAKILPVVCGQCGYVRFFADEASVAKLPDAKGWDLV